jgi:hypothetical protein
MIKARAAGWALDPDAAWSRPRRPGDVIPRFASLSDDGLRIRVRASRLALKLDALAGRPPLPIAHPRQNKPTRRHPRHRPPARAEARP